MSTMPDRCRSGRREGHVKGLFISLVALIAASWMPSARSAANPFPAPTGAYAVGRTQFHWTDTSRVDPTTPSHHREIAVWVWYPAAPRPGAVQADWLPGKWQGFLSSQLIKSKPDVGDGAEAIHTHAYSDAAFAADGKTLPILVFSPGMSMVPLAYSNLIEDVVSHGYVVAGIVPTSYLYTVLSTGRVVPGSNPLGQMPPGGVRPKEFGRRLAEDQAKLGQVAVVWSADASFALTELQKLNVTAGSLFRG